MSDLDVVTWMLLAVLAAFGVLIVGELLGRPRSPRAEPSRRDRLR